MKNWRNEKGNLDTQEELLKIIKDFKKKTGVYPYGSQLVKLGLVSSKQKIYRILPDLIRRGTITIQPGARSRQLTIR